MLVRRPEVSSRNQRWYTSTDVLGDLICPGADRRTGDKPTGSPIGSATDSPFCLDPLERRVHPRAVMFEYRLVEAAPTIQHATKWTLMMTSRII
jgi:hypothetical protein